MDELLFEIGQDALREVTSDSGYCWWLSLEELGGVGVTQAHGEWIIKVSESLGPKVLTASYYTERRFSDHAPLIVDYDIEL